jgi:gas vesicle protein
LEEVYSMSNGRDDFFSFLGGFLFGAVVGGILGILFAPKPGEETRKDIKESAEKLYERGKEIYGEQKEKLEEAIETGREAVTQKSEELKSRLSETAAKLRERVQPQTPEAEKGETPKK